MERDRSGIGKGERERGCGNGNGNRNWIRIGRGRERERERGRAGRREGERACSPADAAWLHVWLETKSAGNRVPRPSPFQKGP
jgi:hypothetical protein